MYTQADLTKEIQDVLEGMEDTRAWEAEWITQAVLGLHQEIAGSDADFYVCMARNQVHTAVRKHLNRYKLTPEVEADRQIVMEGFERLQQRYAVEEHGVERFVRIQDLTKAQLMAKVNELLAMGRGCYQHADELERFMADKFKQDLLSA